MAIGVVQEAAPRQEPDAGTIISDGQLVNEGAELSVMVTLKLQAALRPTASVIVYLT